MERGRDVMPATSGTPLTSTDLKVKEWTLEEVIEFLKEQWENGVTVEDGLFLVKVFIPKK